MCSFGSQVFLTRGWPWVSSGALHRSNDWLSAEGGNKASRLSFTLWQAGRLKLFHVASERSSWRRSNHSQDFLIHLQSKAGHMACLPIVTQQRLVDTKKEWFGTFLSRRCCKWCMTRTSTVVGHILIRYQEKRCQLQSTLVSLEHCLCTRNCFKTRSSGSWFSTYLGQFLTSCHNQRTR